MPRKAFTSRLSEIELVMRYEPEPDRYRHGTRASHEHSPIMDFQTLYAIAEKTDEYELSVGIMPMRASKKIDQLRGPLVDEFLKKVGRCRYIYLADACDSVDTFVENEMLPERLYGKRGRDYKYAYRLHDSHRTPFRLWKVNDSDVIDFGSVATLRLPKSRCRDVPFPELARVFATYFPSDFCSQYTNYVLRYAGTNQSSSGSGA